MTIADQILYSSLAKDGGWFSASQMAKHLRLDTESVRFELRQMAENEILNRQKASLRQPAKYQVRRRHWIHARPLADTSWMWGGV
jgi:predicted ArsR family transcriptional regulator